MSRISRKTLEESQQLFVSEKKGMEQLQSEYFVVSVRQHSECELRGTSGFAIFVRMNFLSALGEAI